MKTKLLTILVMLAMLFGLLPGSVMAAPAAAQMVVPVMGTLPAITVVAVNDSPGNQTDPHISGDWVSYTDSSAYGVRFQNLKLGTASDRLIPVPDATFDSLSDINGNSIVFLRVASSSDQGIYLVQVDLSGNPGPAIEVSPSANTYQRNAKIGGDTIAYEDCDSDSSLPEISISSVSDPAAPAYRLTNDLLPDHQPGLSPEGNVTVWRKCDSSYLNCHVWRAERTNGNWSTPEQVTVTDGNEYRPDTNGPVTVYGSIAANKEENVGWSVKNSSGEFVDYILDLPGLQRSPTIAGNLIAFEGVDPTGSQLDIWLYNLATNRLYQLTNTPISEALSDITIGSDGVVRVAWAQSKTVSPYDTDVYAMSFVLDTTPPVITPQIQGVQGQNGWYTSDVTLSWAITDNESPVGSTNGCDPVTIASDQLATDYTCSADSDGGAASQTVSIARDATKPVSAVTGVTEGASYELGSVPQAGCASTDNLSGVATEATLALTGGDAQGVGAITATCSGALDAAGNFADAAAVQFAVTNPVSDTYTFSGFFQPVDNPGEGPDYIFNSVKAGSAVPVKFSLNGDQGLNIFASGYPLSQAAPCASAELINSIEETVTASSSGLSYDADSDTYTYVWKTDKKWASTCRLLNVTLDDGTEHLAYFQFK
jgi:hypothetical protein